MNARAAAAEAYEKTLKVQMSRVSVADERRLGDLAKAGADKEEMARFYWGARKTEMDRVSSLASDADRAAIAALLRSNAERETLDEKFDEIKKRVDLGAFIDKLPAARQRTCREEVAALDLADESSEEEQEPEPVKGAGANSMLQQLAKQAASRVRQSIKRQLGTGRTLAPAE